MGSIRDFLHALKLDRYLAYVERLRVRQDDIACEFDWGGIRIGPVEHDERCIWPADVSVLSSRQV